MINAAASLKSPPSESVGAPSETAAAISAPELAALLTARVCHDLINPAGAMTSGLDLLEDPSAQDMRADAMSLIAASARKLTAQLSFARVAFGASASAQTFASENLRKLAQGVFDDVRPTLDWAVETPAVNKAAGRVMLNLAQIGATALPTGGVAKLTAVPGGGDLLIALEAEGARARLRPEVAAGLKGERSAEGGPGHWVQAYYLHALLREAGGKLAFAAGEGKVVVRVRVPLDLAAV